MRNRMITLCDASHAESQLKPNFSAWVRKQLLGQGQPYASQLSEQMLLAVVLARMQDRVGYEHEICQDILALMQKV